MLVRLEGEGALYLRLYRGLRSAIVDGRLAPRARLPSTRTLAGELGLSRNVILAAFDQLLVEGYIEGRTGSGTYVAASLPDAAIAPWRGDTAAPAGAGTVRLSKHARRIAASQPLPPPGARPPGPLLPYDFRYGRPALEAFPQAVWSRLVARHARTMSKGTLGYGRAGGLTPLREVIADYLRRARGVRASAEQVLIVNGTQQAIDLVARLLLDPGDRVVVEEPGYQMPRQVFLGAGARLIAGRVDRDGLDVAALPRRPAVRLVYVTPSHQFPLGAVLPRARRLELLRWAEATRAFVLEDDHDSEFRYDTRPVEALQGLDRRGRVLYTGSFSKVMFPSLRVGYLVVPEALVETATALKFLLDYATPTFEQEVLTDFIGEGHFERHLRRMRALYAGRRAILLEALGDELGDRVEVMGTDAGLHVVVYVRGLAATAVPALITAARGAGVGIYPLAPYHLRAPRRAGLILGYAGLDERELRTGVRRLAEVVAQVAPPAG